MSSRRETIFLLGVLAFTFCGCSVGRLSPKEIQTEFEHDSGFVLPQSATGLCGFATRADFHGDYGMVVSFAVSSQDLTNFMSLPQKAWERPDQFARLEYSTRMLKSEADAVPSLKEFQVPEGSLYIQQRGPGDVIREMAVDPVSRRIYYSRSTW
jgi:hypothetical protein